MLSTFDLTWLPVSGFMSRVMCKTKMEFVQSKKSKLCVLGYDFKEFALGELLYDLTIPPISNVSRSPGFESVLGV